MRWTRSLLARLLAPYLVTLLAVAACMWAYTERTVDRLYSETLADAVLYQARLAGELLPWDTRGPEMDARCAAVAADVAARVTVIAPDGTVLGDSDAPSAQLENHRSRPEVLAALNRGEGEAVRVSASVQTALFYRAWRQKRRPDGIGEQRIIRLSVPMGTVDRARRQIRLAIWGGVGLAALAALWPALASSRRLSARVARLTAFSSAVTAEREPPALAAEANDVIGRLEANLLAMAGSLRTRLLATREEKSKLEAVLRGMVEAVLVIDRAGTVRLSNQRADQLFGRPAGRSLVGEPLLSFARDPDFHDLVRTATAGGGTRALTREIARRAAGGDEQHLLVTLTPILKPAGDPQTFIVVAHDVTALKKLEATRRDFVANVSHELRTPLTAIQGYSETLLDGALDDPAAARKFVAIIERHAQHLGRLVDDLLALSDLELGHTTLQREAVSVSAAVDGALEMLRGKAAAARVALRREIADTVPAVDADPDRIQQILVNLVDNAIKYTPDGGTVTVRACALGPGQDSHQTAIPDCPVVEIAVADTGIGIPSQDLPRLTERFYRVDKARSRELGGTGLGLAIVKHIAHAHGGWLHIESELNRGTTVRVYLPQHPGEGVPPEGSDG